MISRLFMRARLIVLAFLLAVIMLPAVAWAYEYFVAGCSGANCTVQGVVMMFLNGSNQAVPWSSSNIPSLSTTPAATTPPYVWQGDLAVTSSAPINTMTLNGGTSLPTNLTNLTVYNVGSVDVAFCAKGGTCTCPTSTAAGTDGLIVKAGGGSYQFYFGSVGLAASTPTIVPCSGTGFVQFQG